MLKFSVCVDVNGVCVGHFYIYNVAKCTAFCEFNESVFVCLHMLLLNLLWALVQL